MSHAVHRLNVSYGVKFNWVYGLLRGAVFQGRFKSVVIQDEKRVGPSGGEP